MSGTGVLPIGGACQLQYVSSAGAGSVPCLSQTGSDVFFTGCNVHVQNGVGNTTVSNGLGNFIVGYNENFGALRTGSHNLVVGPYHEYTGYGGLVAGSQNTITGPSASVTGGIESSAVVSGGDSNEASNFEASVSGGSGNHAMAFSSTIGGGTGVILGAGGVGEWHAETAPGYPVPGFH